MNTQLMDLLGDVPQELREQLYQRLIQREDNALDGLRVAAATQGLMPSMTGVILYQTGLGTPPSPEAWALLTAQAEAEFAELRAAIEEWQRQHGES
jgi:hypothetical protein